LALRPVLGRADEHFDHVVVQAVVELSLERPLELGMVEVPGVKLEVVGVHGHGWILEIYQDFNAFTLGPSGEIEQRVFVKLELGENAFESRIWEIGHRMILRVLFARDVTGQNF
jgi:hypothetical protein